MRDGLLVALDHVNEARMRRHLRRDWELDACRDAYGALNQLASLLETSGASPSDRNRSRPSEVVKHCNLLADLPSQVLGSLLDDPVVGTLAEFKPLILDHGSPGMTQRIEDLTDEVRATASVRHLQFRRCWHRWQDAGFGVAETAKKLIRAVLVVRNNIAHGEKTPFGPDPARRERNLAVARVVLPVVEAVIDAVLDVPSHKLAAYGTLRRGEANEHVPSIDGTWSPITLTGRLWDESGFSAFTFAVDGEPIAAELFVSDGLPKVWESLDRFEGDRYARRLGLYEENGAIGVANTYEWVGQR